jgi:starvation-inducible DNA-binding protein
MCAIEMALKRQPISIEQSEQIFAMTDDIAERARKIGGTTIHSISEISQHGDWAARRSVLTDAICSMARLRRVPEPCSV